MLRCVDVADLKDVWKFRRLRNEGKDFARQDGNFRIGSLQRRPSTYILLKDLASSRKTAPVSLLSPKFR
jgi:hypothetical protein